MKNVISICLMFVVVCFVSYRDANANYNWSENLDFEGIHFSASAGNHEDDITYANCWGLLEQGVEGRYYQYQNSNMSFSTDSEDTSEFYFGASWSFLILPFSAYVSDFGIDAGQGSNFNAFGVSLHMQSDVRNALDWVADEPENPDGEWHSIVTDDIEMSFHLNLEPAHITNINLYVNEWTWEKEDEGVIQNIHMLEMSFNGRGHFIAETEEGADELGAIFSQQIPEPATISVLSLGGIFLRNLRKKK